MALDGVIDQWIDTAKKCQYLPENDLKVRGTIDSVWTKLNVVLPFAHQKLCEYVCDLLLEESNVQPVSSPVTVCGDIHGQVRIACTWKICRVRSYLGDRIHDWEVAVDSRLIRFSPPPSTHLSFLANLSFHLHPPPKFSFLTFLSYLHITDRGLHVPDAFGIGFWWVRCGC